MAHIIEPLTENILFITFSGVIDEAAGDLFYADIFEILDRYPEKASVSFLLNAQREDGPVPYKTRKGLVKLFGDERIDRIAMVTSYRATRVVVGFVLKAIGRSHVQFFATVNEAADWLESQM